MHSQEQIPVLCAQCLGPASPGPDGSVLCGHCGHRGMLPSDHHERALELSRRMQGAAAAAAQMRGMESALAHIFESPWAFLRTTGLFAGFALIIGVYTLSTSWNQIASAPGEVRATLLVNSVMAPAALGGFALALGVALAISRRAYRKRVRPLLFARAPLEEGLPARCRACGGPLPDRRDAFIGCTFCHTQNLVTRELAANRKELLEREHRFYADRAQRVVAATSRGLPNMQNVFVIAGVVVYALIIALGALANALLPG